MCIIHLQYHLLEGISKLNLVRYGIDTSRPYITLFLQGANTISRAKCVRKFLATLTKSLSTPTKLLLERVFKEVSRGRAHFYHPVDAAVYVLIIMPADSRAFEDYQINKQ